MPKRAGVLGRPVAHSLSPVLHSAGYAEFGMDWSYAAIDCGVDDLPGVLAERSEWAGFSCTMPLKHAVLDLATHVSPVAEATGAANTLLPGPDGWIADNTDVAGILEALHEHEVRPSSATVLGAGGTAQAALVACHALDIRHCTVLVRDPSRTGGVQDTVRRLGMDLEVHTFADPVPTTDLVVSTLPGDAADPFRSWAWRTGQTLLDVRYDPWPTPLAAAAAAGGATVVSGALMLLHQATAQWSLMTGLTAPEPAMRRALAAAAPGCGV